MVRRCRQRKRTNERFFGSVFVAADTSPCRALFTDTGIPVFTGVTLYTPIAPPSWVGACQSLIQPRRVRACELSTWPAHVTLETFVAFDLTCQPAACGQRRTMKRLLLLGCCFFAFVFFNLLWQNNNCFCCYLFLPMLPFFAVRTIAVSRTCCVSFVLLNSVLLLKGRRSQVF